MTTRSPAQRKLQVRRLDRHLASLRLPANLAPPAGGWVKAIRLALGMTLEQLGQRLGIARPTAHQLEARETQGAITLRQLERAAAALDCDLFYALVPKTSLEDTIRRRAREKLDANLAAANVSMRLEDQGVATSALEEVKTSTESFTEAVVDRHLWDD